LWTELTGKAPSDRSLTEEIAARPTYFARLRRIPAPRRPLVKSHTLVGEVDGFPTYNFDPRDRIVHIVRHPCDVALSVADYFGLSIDDAIEQISTPGLYHYDPPNIGYELIGSWAQHTRSWMRDLGVPVYRIRYFELLLRPVDIMIELAEFLGLEPDRARAELAVEFSSFDRLKAEEQQTGFCETASTARKGYFRKGRAGQWLSELSIEQAQRIIDCDPELVEMLGFSRVVLA
jgi:hypothetical protein